MRRNQVRLWHLMSLVMLVALLAAGYVWLFPTVPTSESPDVVFIHDVWVTLDIAGFEVPHTSPLFWLIVGIFLTALLASAAGLIILIAGVARAIGRTRK